MIDFAFVDSGVGGLPYLKALKEKSPASSCVYVADTKNFPYGEKPTDKIIAAATSLVEKIIENWNPNVIVLACNTISVNALESLRSRFPSVPFVGTVPAIKPASLVSKTRRIGLLATAATIRNSYSFELQKQFASDCTVVSRADPELISFIEHRFFSSAEDERIEAVKPAVDFFKENGCDAIVLACTHFLNISDYIQKYAGNEMYVVDSRDGVSRHALEVEKQFLVAHPEISSKDSEEVSRLFVTGFTNKDDSRFYEKFCAENDIQFGGVLYNQNKQGEIDEAAGKR